MFKLNHQHSAANKSLRDGLFGIALLLALFGCASNSSTQREMQAGSLRLWCSSPEGFYPQVANCPSGWQRLASPYQPGDATPPLWMIPVPPPSQEKTK